MPIETAQQLEEEVIAIVMGFSGRRSIKVDELLGRDIGIYGGDGVQLVEALEDRFQVDLNPFIQGQVVFLRPNWWDRLRGRKHGPPVADCTVRQLIDYIREHRRT